MSKIAVIAHAGKSFGGGLLELRSELERQGVDDPLWIEVPKSGSRPKQVKRALAEGAELIFVWGGDGTVAALHRRGGRLGRRRSRSSRRHRQPARDEPRHPAGHRAGQSRSASAASGASSTSAASTASDSRVMAGAGFDASMIQRGRRRRSRTGSGASPTSGPARKNLRAKPFKAKIEVDGAPWYAGAASCILVGNVGRLFGGVEVFEDARPDDGRLEIGVVNADGVTDWVRTLARTAVGQAERSPLVQATRAKKIKVKLNRKVLYEVDGGDREKVKSLHGQGGARGDHHLRTEEAVERHSPARRNRRRPRSARSAGEGFVNSRLFAILSRAGFVARALIYGIIGVLAFDLAVGQRRQDHEPAGRAPDGRAALIRARPACPARGRPRRLRALAVVPRRPRPRPRGRRPRYRTRSARSAAASSTR